MSSPIQLEPGLFGIGRPVLLLPEGITEHLTPAQFEAVVAHEWCHVRRWDNLAAAIHMAVEALFWFHPLVWWIERRLVEERERACDEEVLRMATAPKDYAEGILNVCRFCLGSPAVSVLGVTGGNLKQRVEAIMLNRDASKLNFARKLLLAGSGMLALAGPLVVGILDAPKIRAQNNTIQSPQAAPVAARAEFEVASIKPASPDEAGISGEDGRNGVLKMWNVSLKRCIRYAYTIPEDQILEGPKWIDELRYDILAKADHLAGEPELLTMLQPLLADRFRLQLHHETRMVRGYTLTVAKGGIKAAPADPRAHSGGNGGRGFIDSTASQLSGLTIRLSALLGRPVVDMTGDHRKFDFHLRWTPDETQTGADSVLPDRPSLFTALQEQLGLKLESGKVSADALVVDHAELPTDN